MNMRSNALAGATASILLLMGVALVGCSDQTKEAASNTMNSAAQDTQNHVAAADQAVKNTGHEVAVAGHDAAVATKDAAHDAAKATKDAAVATGDAVKDTGHYVGKAVGGTVKGVAVGVDNAGKAVEMTPVVKDALIRSNLDTSTINVDTDAKTNTVLLKGTVHSAAQKQEASQIAKSAIDKTGRDFSVKNELSITK
jgi:osmotically-inducible protein OsmY